MKYDMTQEDYKVIAYDLANNRTLKHLRNLLFYKFTIGDIIVREDKHKKFDGSGTFEWKTKLADCGIAYKYVYVFENELGVGYIRRLSVTGRTLVDRPICVTEFDPDVTRFTLDPEYADHMLLSNENDEFDAKSRYNEVKKKREQVHRKNKKLCVQIDDEFQAVVWIKTLKIGDQIWWGHNIANIYKDPYFVNSVDINANNSKCLVRLTLDPGGQGYVTQLYAGNLVRYSIFMQRPTFVEDIVN